jgi:DNA-binding NarL/FixJ family response regulator
MSVRVLVVDDSLPFRLAAAAVIAAVDGFELVGAVATGEASVQAVDELAPDLVVMDIRLPGIDGREATRQIRGRQPSVRVLLVSTDDPLGAPDGCGAFGYLPKQALSPDRLQRVWAGRPEHSPQPHITDDKE